jgi:outer membrane biosynthesis protein TonB
VRGSIHRFFTILFGAILTLHLIGCESLDTSARGEGTGIQIGGAIYAAIKYKQLTDREAEMVRIDAQRVFDRKVEREVQKQRAKAKPRSKPKRPSTPVKPKPTPKPKPSSPSSPSRPAPRPKPTQPTQPTAPPTPAPTTPAPDTAAEDAALEIKIRQVAVRTVKAKYGTNIAVPVKTPDNKAVVAFATVVGEKVSLTTRTAYELNISGAQIAKAANRNSPVRLDGAKYALLDETTVSISKP